MYKIFLVIKQMTAYEMRISDWSSDVCSTDLPRPGQLNQLHGRMIGRGATLYCFRPPPGHAGDPPDDATVRPCRCHQPRPRGVQWPGPQLGRASFMARVWPSV